MPRHLQSEIHSDFSRISGTWINYRAEITGLWGSTVNKDDFNNHLIREFNRKLRNLSMPSGIYIIPYNAGFSYTGTTGLIS
jgi:hypothetical protein